ncbi:MAG TPA: response regulator transcription factor, partial [Gammaproteobacteria bacterium]|nr:response regulator transcription factor [Gammaproteobacteria bacterium]
DVVLLDMSMPGKSGLEVLKQIKQEYPKLPVLILSMHPEDQYAVRVHKAGAAGYLTKRCVTNELVQAVYKVAAGGKYISETVAERLALSIDPTATAIPHETLSDREYQVFQMLASGKQVSAIARELSLSSKTISTHRSKILTKMQMKSNSELMFYAINYGLISQEKNLS